MSWTPSVQLLWALDKKTEKKKAERGDALGLIFFIKKTGVFRSPQTQVFE